MTARVKERDHYLCRMCLAEGRITRDNLSVHHIVPLHEQFDLRLDDENLVTLCGKCHRLADAGAISREKLREIVKNCEFIV